jgi:hypothetical protein
MLGMKNDAADFYGGLVGDLAWTIEPIFALFIAPKILASAKPDEVSTLGIVSLIVGTNQYI